MGCFQYSQYSVRKVQFRKDYFVEADSKEEADRLIKENTTKRFGLEPDEDSLIEEGEELIDSDNGVIDNFYICDEDDTIVISKNTVDENNK